MAHAEPTAGLCSVTKMVLATERAVVPANLHYEEPNKEIPALSDGRIKVVDKNTPWQGGLVALNSFGSGGSNAHVVLEGGPGARPPPAAYPAPHLVLASGRTEHAVERLLRLAAEHPRDAELHALLDAVHARAAPGHRRRGYAVLGPERGAPLTLEVFESDTEPRPLWFMFSGFGSQWHGAARALLRLPAFAASITRSAAALEPHGFNLHYLLMEAPEAAFDVVINAAVSITAVQVALVDVLRELDIRPDGIIGVSLGETAAAYADEALTGEQAVLCAYWRGRSIMDADLAPGSVAGIGLSWEDVSRRCPADIEPTCDCSASRTVVAGPPESIEKFVAELLAEGVWARRADKIGVAFHSKYIAAAAPLLHNHLLKLIPEPKKRSARWLSTSVLQEREDSDLVRICDAAYFVNNLLSPVWCTGVLARLPARALLVELAPHALLQSLLKSQMLGAVHVPLMLRGVPDALAHMLAAVGKIYAAGAQPQVLVWRTIAIVINLELEDAAVVLENIEFRHATIVSHDAPLLFVVSVLRGSDEFKFSESGAVVATGGCGSPPQSCPRTSLRERRKHAVPRLRRHIQIIPTFRPPLQGPVLRNLVVRSALNARQDRLDG